MKKYQDAQLLKINLQSFRKCGVYKKTKFELSDADLSVLYCINFYEGEDKIKLTNIAGKLNLTLPAITHKVNDLEKRNLLIKTNSEIDKRIINVELTKEVSKYLDEIKDQYFKPFIALSKRLGEEDTKSLIRIIEKAITLGKIQK